MAYDIHGVWDLNSIWIGPFLKGHTKFTEIEGESDLLWRNGVDSKMWSWAMASMGVGSLCRVQVALRLPTANSQGPRSLEIAQTSPISPRTMVCSLDKHTPCSITNVSYAEVMSKQTELSTVVKYNKKSSVK
jgi:hypothetical protein